MFRLLLMFLFSCSASLLAADPAAVPPPVPLDVFDYSFVQIVVLLLVGLIMTVVAVPVCLILWAILLFGVVMVFKVLGVPPQALLMKMIQRQMMGKNKGLVWQLAALICIPAGIAGLWISTKIFSAATQSGTLLLLGSLCGVALGVGFVKLTKLIAGRAAKKMMGGGKMAGNMMQSDLMSKMMKLRQRK